MRATLSWKRNWILKQGRWQNSHLGYCCRENALKWNLDKNSSIEVFQNSWSAWHFQWGFGMQETCRGIGILGTSGGHLSEPAVQSLIVDQVRSSQLWPHLVKPWKPQEWSFHPISALKLSLSLQVLFHLCVPKLWHYRVLWVGLHQYPWLETLHFCIK